VSHLAYCRRASRIVATLAATAWLAACGYKGPLYMPQAGSAKQSREPVIKAPFSFKAAPGVNMTTAYPTLPSSADSQ
jgi:predicted small lipoprotein YifL